MPGSANIHIGTSGWQYDHWRGPFYPEDISQDDFLAYYSERFQIVEINNSFYRVPAGVSGLRPAPPRPPP